MFMKKRDMNLSYAINAIEQFALWLVGPSISYYFITKVDSNILGEANLVGAVGLVLMASVIKKDKFLNFALSHYKMITIIDLVFYIVVSYGTVDYPRARMLLNTLAQSVTAYLVSKTWTAAVNRKISGDELTKYNTTREQYCTIGKLVGSALSAIISTMMNVEVAITIAVVTELLVVVVSNYLFFQISKLSDNENNN